MSPARTLSQVVLIAAAASGGFWGSSWLLQTGAFQDRLPSSAIAHGSPEGARDTGMDLGLERKIGLVELLGTLTGGGVGLAIARRLSSKPAEQSQADSSGSPHQQSHHQGQTLPSPSQVINLADLRSPDIKLTTKQREVLYCLWVMAAIAPHRFCPGESPAQAQPVGWAQLFHQLQQSSMLQSPALREDLRQMLSELGISNDVIQIAWQVVMDAEIDATGH